MKKIIKLKDVDPILFAGVDDKNLNFITDRIKTKIVLRGDELHMDGLKRTFIAIHI